MPPHDDPGLEPYRPRVPTLAAWLALWMERRRDQLRPHTRVNHARIARNYVVPHLGDRRLDEVDRRLLERTYAHLLAAGGKDGRPLAPGSVANVHVMQRTALKDACQAGLIDVNPVDQAEVRIRRSLSVVDGGVHLLPTKSARPRVLCIADSVVEAVPHHHPARRLFTPLG